MGLANRFPASTGRGHLPLFALVAATTWAILLVFVASLVLKPWPDSIFRIDFVAFWSGAYLVREGVGSDLYDLEQQHLFQVAYRREHATVDSIRLAPRSLPYINPPPLALLFVPLTYLPISSAYLIWSTVSVAAVMAAVALPLRGCASARTLATLVLAVGAVPDVVLLGRVDGVLLLAFTGALLLLSSGCRFRGGALAGLLWLKPQYALPLSIVFLMKGRKLELAGMAASALGVLALSAAMVGLQGLLRYAEILGQLGSYYPPPAAVIDQNLMVNWRGLLWATGVRIPESEGSALLLVLEIATLLGSLLAWRGSWAPSSPRFAAQMLVVVLATLLAAPHSHFHGTVLLLGPLALAIGRGLPNRRRLWWGMLATGYLLGLFCWVFLEQRWLMVPYFLASMGLLIYETWADPSGRRYPEGLNQELGGRVDACR